ncbi:MAG: DNA-directed RNA polymerase subunit alpha [Candidatus Harrisonbacteria bacterium CG10_big_fil_rev_8_21_14_0_10_40_38]|uniref:DNA-directed RNA polymerase subunit alpha n=1 Tax=Candidatus Harrisonbacteria bacterium CG10_big_fil_rev_8_21_14_0_10_40_38 TaxID=1974583 RepID=A0A2H0UU92_9BACT|nr:MAG: DNA-directed RNA polymerase subunit alpha [Candidatus Harrisonbacteria bacterium CG10_big_fil_rev_8_21_14_0_10_40_38]
MQYDLLSETVSIRTVSENEKEGVFEIEGLYTGYGATVGNALRRVLLSSLPGAAITQVKLKGASHEFTAVPGVIEDMVEIMLNLKRIRFRLNTNEPQVLSIRKKGEGEVLASDIDVNPSVEVITPDHHIATVTEKGAEFDMEITVEQGLGYVPAEVRRSEKLPIGVIALDAIFSPVIKVHTHVENMRVGDRTDYDRLRITVETSGSISPSQALHQSTKILQDHFIKLSEVEVKEAKPSVKSSSSKKEKDSDESLAPKKKSTKSKK